MRATDPVTDRQLSAEQEMDEWHVYLAARLRDRFVNQRKTTPSMADLPRLMTIVDAALDDVYGASPDATPDAGIGRVVQHHGRQMRMVALRTAVATLSGALGPDATAQLIAIADTVGMPED